MFSVVSPSLRCYTACLLGDGLQDALLNTDIFTQRRRNIERETLHTFQVLHLHIALHTLVLGHKFISLRNPHHTVQQGMLNMLLTEPQSPHHIQFLSYPYPPLSERSDPQRPTSRLATLQTPFPIPKAPLCRARVTIYRTRKRFQGRLQLHRESRKRAVVPNLPLHTARRGTTPLDPYIRLFQLPHSVSKYSHHHPLHPIRPQTRTNSLTVSQNPD